MSAVFPVEGLGQNADLRQLIQPEKKSRGARGRIAKDRIGRIHTVDQNVRHSWTDTVNCNLAGLTAGKQRRTAAGVGGNSRLQRNRTEQVAVIEGQFRQALFWKQSSDRRRRVIDGGGVRVDRRLLGKVAYRELRIYGHFGGRSDVNSFANLRLESWFHHANRIASHRQTGETVFAGR